MANKTMLQKIEENLNFCTSDDITVKEDEALKQFKAMFKVLRIISKIVPVSVFSINELLEQEYDKEDKENPKVKQLQEAIERIGAINPEATAVLQKEVLKLLNEDNKKADDQIKQLGKRLKDYYKNPSEEERNSELEKTIQDLMEELKKYKFGDQRYWKYVDDFWDQFNRRTTKQYSPSTPFPWEQTWVWSNNSSSKS